MQCDRVMAQNAEIKKKPVDLLRGLSDGGDLVGGGEKTVGEETVSAVVSLVASRKGRDGFVTEKTMA